MGRTGYILDDETSKPPAQQTTSNNKQMEGGSNGTLQAPLLDGGKGKQTTTEMTQCPQLWGGNSKEQKKQAKPHLPHKQDTLASTADQLTPT
jgi:hypothetical protein